MKDKPKPLMPLKHEFYASLDRFVHEAGMLRDAVDMLLKHDTIAAPIGKMLRERVAAFDNARFGEE